MIFACAGLKPGLNIGEILRRSRRVNWKRMRDKSGGKRWIWVAQEHFVRRGWKRPTSNVQRPTSNEEEEKELLAPQIPAWIILIRKDQMLLLP